MSRRNRLIPIAAACAALLFGCGGDDDDGDGSGGGDTSAPTALSNSAYLAEGDRICAEGTARIGELALDKYGSAQPTLEEIGGFARDVVAPTLQEQVDQLRALPPPQGDDATVDEIYDAVEDGIKQLKKDPNLLLEPATGGAFDEANELAQDYGFAQCGSG